MPKWVNRTVGVAPRNGTTSHTITFTAATSGNLLVAIVGGPVTHTWPGGWTERLQPVNNTELSVATKTASAAEASVTVTHNGSNYPVIYAIYEFPAGTTWGVSNSGTGSMVTLTGITVGHTVFCGFNWGVAAGTSSSTGYNSTWSTPSTEDVDTFEPGNGVTDGAYTSIAYADNYGSTSMTPAGGGLLTSGGNRENIAFSLNVPAGGITVAVVAAVAAVPAATVRLGKLITGTAVAAVAAIPAVAAGTGSLKSPATVAAVAAVPAPGVTRHTTQTPATVAAVATVPAPVSVGGRTPATVAAVAAIPAVTAGRTRTFSFGVVTTGQVTGLTASTNYVARIRAFDAAGNYSAYSSTVSFTTTAGAPQPATVAAVAAVPAPTLGAAPPTVTAGRARPVAVGGSVGLDVTVTPPSGQSITGYSWAIQGGGAGSLTNATTATPTYNAPGSGSGTVTVRATVTASNGGSATADVTVAYGPNAVAAENTLTGTARATWDLSSPNFGGVNTLQGFCDGFSYDKTQTVNFKIAQSDSAGWSAEVFRLGYYSGNGARSYGTLTPDSTQLADSQSQPSPTDVDTSTTLLSADCSGWDVTLTWTPPAWAPSGIYILRLNRTGGGASHVMFILRDDARAADLMFMPADSTWMAYNAFGGMGSSMYTGNSFYYGTAVDQYQSDCGRFVSYNRPFVNRGACDSGRAYGGVEWSTFFTGEYGMLRFIERNGIDVKYYGCIDAGGDSTGTFLTGNGSTRAGVNAAIFVGHNEYWSTPMRSGWETARDNGVSVFSCAGNEVFWRIHGTNPDSEGRPRTYECQKSTIQGRGNTRPEWTGSWRDPDGAGKGGDNPENLFTGTIFVVNGPNFQTLQVPFAGGYSTQPLWRDTDVAALTTGQTWTSPAQILGFEWDTYGPAGVSTTAANYLAAPHPRVRYCSTATHSVGFGVLLTDAGDVYDASGTATHRLVVYPGGDGAIVFGTGTVNWGFGVDDCNTYQVGDDNVSDVIQQATLNILTDMGAPPTTVMAGLVEPTPVVWFLSPDVVAATAAIPAPTVTAQQSVTRTPGVVAAVAAVPAPSVSTTSGTTRSPATVAAVAAVPSATVAAGAGRTPAVVAATAAVPAPTVSGGTGATPTPAAVAAATSVPIPTVSGASGTTVQPTVVAAVAALPSATAVAGSTLNAVTVASVAIVPAPTAGGHVNRTLTTVAGVAAIASPTVTAIAHATKTPATVMALAAIPAAQVSVYSTITYRPYTGITYRP